MVEPVCLPRLGGSLDLGAGSRNKLSGWVDSDFASRKYMTGYLMVLNGGPISWKASRQGGVTLSSSEAEFVAASQAGQEVLYLRALLEGFAYYSMVLQRFGKITRLVSL